MILSRWSSQVDCYEVYALVPGLLREEVRISLDDSLFCVSRLLVVKLHDWSNREKLEPVQLSQYIIRSTTYVVNRVLNVLNLH